MSEKELRRSMSVLPIGTVMLLTDLTARQIRYYEEHQLITPKRSNGNRRLFSLNDIDVLLEINDLLQSGMTMADIKETFGKKKQPRSGELSDTEMRVLLRDELLKIGRLRDDRNPFSNGPYL